jgi:hypothetical protein
VTERVPQSKTSLKSRKKTPKKKPKKKPHGRWEGENFQILFFLNKQVAVSVSILNNFFLNPMIRGGHQQLQPTIMGCHVVAN